MPPEKNTEVTDKHDSTAEKTSGADKVEESSIFGTLGKYGTAALEEARTAIQSARQFLDEHKKDIVIGVLPGPAAGVESGKVVADHIKQHAADYAAHAKDHPVAAAAEMLLCPPLFFLDAEQRKNMTAENMKKAAEAAALGAAAGGALATGAMGVLPMLAAEAAAIAGSQKK